MLTLTTCRGSNIITGPWVRRGHDDCAACSSSEARCAIWFTQSSLARRGIIITVCRVRKQIPTPAQRLGSSIRSDDDGGSRAANALTIRPTAAVVVVVVAMMVVMVVTTRSSGCHASDRYTHNTPRRHIMLPPHAGRHMLRKLGRGEGSTVRRSKRTQPWLISCVGVRLDGRGGRVS